MSSNEFPSWDAEQAQLLQQAQEQQSLYPQDQTELQDLMTPYIDEASQWAHAHTSATGYEYFHPMPLRISYTQMPLPAAVLPSQYGLPYSQPDLQYASMPATSYTQPNYILPMEDPSLSTITSADIPSSTSASPTLSSSTITSHHHHHGFNLAVPGTTTTSTRSTSRSKSRSPSPGVIAGPSITTTTTSIPDLSLYGTLSPTTNTWTCAYPSCSSKAIFARPCDLRKHFNRHSKNYFCRYEGCPQATEGGFSSKKDRARHEGKHNPGIECEWEGCERIFSRRDNMRNHLMRRHLKKSTSQS